MWEERRGTAGTYLHLVLVLDGRGGAVVDAHRALSETVLLLEVSVKEVQRLGELWWAVLEGLLEEVASALELVAALQTRLGELAM